jgi:sucrose-6-phosphate hydrolase SacC (GH32 family)
MNKENRQNVSRRSFLAASAALVMSQLAWTESTASPALCWALTDRGDTARETITGTNDPIASRTGRPMWVGEGRNRALRLDGYSVWIDHTISKLPLSGSAVTVSAWLALESYPVNEAAIVQQGDQADSGFSFMIDRWGYLQFASPWNHDRKVCKSDNPLPKGDWIHVAVTVTGSGEVKLYRNGDPCGHASWEASGHLSGRSSAITIAKSDGAEIIGGIFPTGVLNGLIKDVCVFDDALSRTSLKEVMDQSKPDDAPALDINGPWCAADRQRPRYHALPPRAWTNEPHGLIHWNGQYHLFYQKNPNGPYWGHINWGHMTSPDLYQWTEMPVVLSPEPGPDSEGCWSGSVIDHNGKLSLIYTGGDGHRASICLAQSSDGIQFTKYAGNPVIPEPPPGHNYPEFRDPFVWREGSVYYLIIGSAIKDVGGTALLYSSTDLIHWEYRKPLLVGDRETSGVFWEMPIFVKVGDLHALIVCEVPGRASYWLGTWKEETFTPHTMTPQRLDLYNHLLSPTPLTDQAGRVITMGIIPDQRDPKECWGAGWAHLYSLPRLLFADTSERLCQKPFEDIRKWGSTILSLSNLAIREGSAQTIEGAFGTCLNIRATILRGDSQSISLLLRRSPDGQEQTDIRYEWEIGKLVLDRNKSNLDSMVRRDTQEVTYFPVDGGSLELDVFLDESVLEVFVDGRAAFASRIYPMLSNSNGVAVACRGKGAEVQSLTVAQISKPS